MEPLIPTEDEFGRQPSLPFASRSLSLSSSCCLAARPKEDLAESPVPSIWKFSATPPTVDLHYVMDPGQWKLGLAAFPMMSPSQQ